MILCGKVLSKWRDFLVEKKIERFKEKYRKSREVKLRKKTPEARGRYMKKQKKRREKIAERNVCQDIVSDFICCVRVFRCWKQFTKSIQQRSRFLLKHSFRCWASTIKSNNKFSFRVPNPKKYITPISKSILFSVHLSLVINICVVGKDNIGLLLTEAALHILKCFCNSPNTVEKSKSCAKQSILPVLCESNVISIRNLFQKTLRVICQKISKLIPTKLPYENSVMMFYINVVNQLVHVSITIQKMMDMYFESLAHLPYRLQCTFFSVGINREFDAANKLKNFLITGAYDYATSPAVSMSELSMDIWVDVGI